MKWLFALKMELDDLVTCTSQTQIHLHNPSIRICFFLCTMLGSVLPHIHQQHAMYQVLPCLSSPYSSELQISWKEEAAKQPGAAECPANPDSRLGRKWGEGQSSQLVGENMTEMYAHPVGWSRTQATRAVHIYNREGTNTCTRNMQVRYMHAYTLHKRYTAFMKEQRVRSCYQDS